MSGGGLDLVFLGVRLSAVEFWSFSFVGDRSARVIVWLIDFCIIVLPDFTPISLSMSLGL